MQETLKSALIRIPPHVHKQIKIQAAQENKSIQTWLCELAMEKLSRTKNVATECCQVCGGWDINQTRYAKLGTCQKCGRENAALFPLYLNPLI